MSSALPIELAEPHALVLKFYDQKCVYYYCHFANHLGGFLSFFLFITLPLKRAGIREERVAYSGSPSMSRCVTMLIQ